MGRLLGDIEGSELVRDPLSISAVNVREIRRLHDRAAKLPKTLVEELARTTTQAQGVWQEARQSNDFASFRPWLEKIVALKRQEAAAIGYQESPYDALLDEYEPGATTRDVAQVFAALRKELTPLLESILTSGRTPDRELLHRDYPVDRQQEFGKET